MGENEVAIINDTGYHRDSKQSAIAIKFLRWLEHETGWQIQHRDSALGEHRVRSANGQLFLLDGFVRRRHLGKPDVAIEFLGMERDGYFF